MNREAGKGSGRRVEDLNAYEDGHERIFGSGGFLARKKREESLQKLVDLSQELGLYDEQPKSILRS